MILFGPSIIILIPALILGIYAQWKVKSTFGKYSRVRASSQISAGRMAQSLLDGAGLNNVKVEGVRGILTDHYDPRSRTLRLSNPDSDSLAVLGVTAHEVGHAMQHAQAYKPLELRSAIVPVVNFGSGLALPLFLVGLIFSFPQLMWIGILAYSLAVLFTLVTLPVELNASGRAVKLLQDGRFVTSGEELGAVKKVLSAAALTYVAAAAMAVLQLVRMILISRR